MLLDLIERLNTMRTSIVSKPYNLCFTGMYIIEYQRPKADILLAEFNSTF